MARRKKPQSGAQALRSAVLNEIGYLAVRGVSGAVGAMDPGAAVRTAKRVGRAYALSPINKKRFDRAVTQIGFGFPQWEAERVRDCAIGSFENLACLGADMALIPRLLTADGWTHYVSTRNISQTVRTLIESKPSVLITCHCGNFEVLGYTVALLGFPMHALYRPFDSVSLDNYMRRTRSARGMTLVDKFGAVHRLPGLVEAGAPIGFVADQNGGDRGVQTPFFGRLASTYKSIGLLAMQFDANIVCGYARRTGGAGRDGFGYEMTVNDVFGPAEWSTHPDPLFYLTARYRWAIERIVRESPGQYFWMHRIWRSRPRHERLGRPFPESLREKIRLLPWMTDEVLDQVVEQSGIDAATLKRTGQSRLN